MADKPQAQSKMGELFIDIGASGLGTLLKGLNSVSASFLLAKKGATEFLKPIVTQNRQATDYANNLRNANKELGLTYTQTQKIMTLGKQYDFDTGSVLGDISNIIDGLTQFRKYNTLPKGWIEARRLLAQLGKKNIDFRRYTNDAAGALKMIQDIGEGLKEINEIGLKRNVQQEFGLSQESLIYLQHIKEIKESINTLDDKEIDALREQRIAVNKLDDAWKKLELRLLSIWATIATNPINKTVDMLTPGKAKKAWTNEAMNFLMKTPFRGNAVAAYAIYKGLKNAITKNSASNVPNTVQTNMNISDVPTSLPDFDYIPELDAKGVSNLTNITQENNFYIDGSENPLATGNEVKKRMEELQYNSYQSNNLPGR